MDFTRHDLVGIDQGGLLKDLSEICGSVKRKSALELLSCVSPFARKQVGSDEGEESFARLFSSDDVEIIRRELSQRPVAETAVDPPSARVFKFLSKSIVERDSDKVRQKRTPFVYICHHLVSFYLHDYHITLCLPSPAHANLSIPVLHSVILSRYFGNQGACTCPGVVTVLVYGKKVLVASE